ncbi:oligosaccharyl transferase subunit ost3/OST6 [Thoreauomyces humboldtii]|nr:oligosaccharyl transferase subunit ost3/OST6 [Thoreauomyces humboldtii]
MEYATSRDVFKRVLVQAVPTVFYFPPTIGPNADGGRMQNFDAKKSKYAADLHQYVQSKCDVQFTLRAPIDFSFYPKLAMYALSSIGIVTATWHYRHEYILPVVQSRNLWMIALLAWIVLMASGHMWNVVRRPNYFGYENGQLRKVAREFTQQYVFETQAAGFLYAGLSIVFVLLIKIVQGKNANKISHSWRLVAAFLIGYSALIYLFRLKNKSYPYKILF